ncbi:hypothetical protein LZ31DRAFT_597631 [Colletotrichum somersetense]|nr:hypothetical protein LZ31DRAFT_597631 [Colletotrichum somersetense]
MSGTLTVPQRLAFRKWIHSFDDVTPTLSRAAEWLKGQFGKEVLEAVIRLILNHVSLQKSICTQKYCDLCNFSVDLDRDHHDYVMEYSFYPFMTAFPNATQDWSASTLTYLELAMLWFIEHITNKPDWHVKVFDQDIVSK